MFSRPLLPDLINRVRNDVVSRLSVDDVLRRADAEIFARALSGAIHELYGYVDFIARQLFVSDAEDEYLDRQASIWLRVPRKGVAAATGSVTFTVAAGAAIVSGTVLQALDGTQYQTTADATLTAPTATAPVVALVAGVAGNKPAGLALALVSPIAGVQSAAVAGALTGGADVESDDDLRARLIQRIQTPPQGGCKADYEAWALEVPGVTRAWCTPLEGGPLTVYVRFVRDNDANPIPAAADVANVAAYIAALRPVNAQVTVLAPIASPVNFTFTALSNTSPAMKVTITNALTDLFSRESVPGGLLLLSHIREAVSSISGLTDFNMTAPSANIQAASGAMSTLGVITWP